VVNSTGNDRHGRSSCNFTWVASTTSMEVIGAMAVPAMADFLRALRSVATASPSTGVPSVNLTPSGRTIVHSVNSAFDSKALARYGTGWPFSSSVASGSNTAEATACPAWEKA
jgi:hypothetical protein